QKECRDDTQFQLDYCRGQQPLNDFHQPPSLGCRGWEQLFQEESIPPLFLSRHSSYQTNISQLPGPTCDTIAAYVWQSIECEIDSVCHLLSLRGNRACL